MILTQKKREWTKRLTGIRMNSEKWIAIRPDAGEWDDAFLLAVIDSKNQEIAELKRRLKCHS